MKRSCLVLGLALLLACSTAYAGGFLIYEHGAAATGMADARTAIADDVNALYFNPAAISELDGFHVELGMTGIIPLVSYTAAKNPDPDRTYVRWGEPDPVQINDGMNDTSAKIKGYTPIHLYASYKIPSSGVSVGIGVNNPFGLGTFWPGDFDGRFIGTETEIQTFFTQPTVAIDIAELAGFKDSFKLSVAAGYDFVYGTARLTKHIDLRIAELLTTLRDPYGEMRMTGTAMAHGWNVALYAELPDQIAIGASVRSGVSLPFSGDATFTFNEAGQAAITRLGLNLPAEDSGSVTVDLPMNMNFGIAYLGIDRLKIALDFYIAFFSTFDEIDLHFDCADLDPPCDASQDPIQKHWGSSWQIAIGAEYEVIDNLKLRLGYGMVSSPVPAEHYDPSLPDGRRDLICAGVGYGMDWWKIDFGYMLAMWSGTKDNDVGGGVENESFDGKANGTYDSLVSLIALSLSAHF
jgi:long-chain fatty acid transport protein